jgi:hypothetical protein
MAVDAGFNVVLQIPQHIGARAAGSLALGMRIMFIYAE